MVNNWTNKLEKYTRNHFTDDYHTDNYFTDIIQ